MNVVIVTQARYGSSRLPGKILKKINNKSLLEIHLKRLKKSKLARKIIVATTKEEESEHIKKIANNNKCECFQGSLEDVLERFYMAINKHAPEYIVRVTSDCPLVDAEIIDEIIKTYSR